MRFFVKFKKKKKGKVIVAAGSPLIHFRKMYQMFCREWVACLSTTCFVCASHLPLGCAAVTAVTSTVATYVVIDVPTVFINKHTTLLVLFV